VFGGPLFGLVFNYLPIEEFFEDAVSILLEILNQPVLSFPLPPSSLILTFRSFAHNALVGERRSKISYTERSCFEGNVHGGLCMYVFLKISYI